MSRTCKVLLLYYHARDLAIHVGTDAGELTHSRDVALPCLFESVLGTHDAHGIMGAINSARRQVSFPGLIVFVVKVRRRFHTRMSWRMQRSMLVELTLLVMLIVEVVC
jgi:hypothetical protein